MRRNARMFALAAFVSALTGRLAAGEVKAGKEEPQFSFGIMADVQYADVDKPSGSRRHYRTALKKLQQCVADLNTRNLAFTIQCGDFIERGRKSLEAVLAVYDTLTMKTYHVLGNHDFCMARPALLKRLGMDQAYYDFAHGAWRFVVLDAMDVSLSGWPGDSEERKRAEALLEELRRAKRASAASYNGAIGKGQRLWLRSRLADASAKGQKVVVFCHLPAVAASSTEGHLLWNHEEVVAILDSYDCVVAYFAGHDHRGGYAQRSGIHYVTLQGMVEAPRGNAYAVAKAYPDRLEVRGVGKVPSRTLRVLRKARGTEERPEALPATQPAGVP